LNGNNRENEKKERKKKEGKKTQKSSGGGRFHNYLIYRYIKILLLISSLGSTAGIRKEP
jgi:hypothetical protein